VPGSPPGVRPPSLPAPPPSLLLPSAAGRAGFTAAAGGAGGGSAAAGAAAGGAGGARSGHGGESPAAFGGAGGGGEAPGAFSGAGGGGDGGEAGASAEWRKDATLVDGVYGVAPPPPPDMPTVSARMHPVKLLRPVEEMAAACQRAFFAACRYEGPPPASTPGMTWIPGNTPETPAPAGGERYSIGPTRTVTLHVVDVDHPLLLTKAEVITYSRVAEVVRALELWLPSIPRGHILLFLTLADAVSAATKPASVDDSSEIVASPPGAMGCTQAADFLSRLANGSCVCLFARRDYRQCLRVEVTVPSDLLRDDTDPDDAAAPDTTSAPARPARDVTVPVCIGFVTSMVHVVRQLAHWGVVLADPHAYRYRLDLDRTPLSLEPFETGYSVLRRIADGELCTTPVVLRACEREEGTIELNVSLPAGKRVTMYAHPTMTWGAVRDLIVDAHLPQEDPCFFYVLARGQKRDLYRTVDTGGNYWSVSLILRMS
jgi:hypothetical protein